MLGLEERDVERKITAILRILSDSASPVGSKAISVQLEVQGIHLGERAVRYHLKIMDERGLTRLVGHRDGRTITVRGLEELRNSLVTDKIGFVASRIEKLAYQTNVGLRSGTGRVPVDLCLIGRDDYQRVLKAMSRVFDAGYCSSDLVYVASEGAKVGEVTVPEGNVGLATICSSAAVNGCLLKAGIPAYARFLGLLQIRAGEPFRFVDLIEFSGSTVDPCHLFIGGKMTDVTRAAVSGEGKVLASYHEIPMMSVTKADELLQRMEAGRLLRFSILAKPGERICEIAFNHEKAGLITLSGLNPGAAAAEAGIQLEDRPMCGMIEVSRLRPVSELL